MLLSQVDDHRAQLAGITTLARDDLASYAVTLLDEPPAKVAAQLRAATSAVITTYGETAAVAGALFYETSRPQPGFTARLVTPALGGKLESDIGWALDPLFHPDMIDPADMVDRLSGVAQKHVANADRQTVFQAARKDPTSRGVRWYASAGACAFCALMSSQAARTSDPHWHRNCHCVEVPGWDDSPIPDVEYMNRYSDAAYGAREHLLELRRNHPDIDKFPHMRGFLKAHPELSVNNKNLTRVMRELYGFDH